MVPVLPVPHRSLTLAAFTRDNVWMRVVPDKQLSFEGFVAAGSTRTWEAQVEIFIRIGNVEAVSLTLNGQPIDTHSGAVKAVNEMLLTQDSLNKKSSDLPRTPKATESEEYPSTEPAPAESPR